MKDNFSEDASEYAKYRPGYPIELIDLILSKLTHKQNAWDCATGNGQLAKMIAPYFDKIYATDISEEQLSNAQKMDNIIYSKQGAEKTDFSTDFFDLIVVAQAVHWFDFEKFYEEVRRVSKADALIALIGYDLISTTSPIDDIIFQLYKEVLGGYWDIERRHIDAAYSTIPFPFVELATPQFSYTADWTFEQLYGYLNTWSAVKHYQKANNNNPVEYIAADLKKVWGDKETMKITFPILCRLGRVSREILDFRG